MAMIRFDADVSLVCAKCGGTLYTLKEQSVHIYIQPCGQCLGVARDAAEQEGYDAGLRAGKKKGAADGK